MTLYRFFPYGGAQRDALAVAHGLLRRGHQVSWLGAYWEGEVPRPEGVQWLQASTAGLSNHARMAHFSKQVQRHRSDYDCVLGFSRSAGVDVYFCADNALAVRMQGKWRSVLPRYRQLLKLERAALGAAHVLFLNSQQRDEFARYYKGFSAHVLPPALSLPSADGVAAPALERGRERLLAVATDTHNKGLDRVLQLYAHLPQEMREHFELAVVTSESGAALLDQIRELGVLRIEPGPGLGALYLSATLLLHPARREAGGKVLLEAAALGLPMLASAVCGYTSLLHRSGVAEVLEEPYDEERAAQQLCALLNDRERLKRMAQAGQSWGAKAVDESYVEKVADVVEQTA